MNKDNTIDIVNVNGESEKIAFDYLVLATGFGYESPIKDEKSINVYDRVSAIEQY